MQPMEEDAQEWPHKITIGTKKAYDNQYFWLYERMTIDGEECYVGNKGSNYSRGNELLVLRRDCFHGDNGMMIIWTAFDASKNSDGSIQLRQAVFRAIDQHIHQPGWHQWQTNHQAQKYNNGQMENWKDKLVCETKVFSNAKPM